MKRLEESIDIKIFMSRVKELLGKNDYIKRPRDEAEIMKVSLDRAGDVVGIQIDSVLIKMGVCWDEKESFDLKATEFISKNSLCKMFQHDKFSFDFRAIDDEEIKKFRIDYLPQALCPLHAHDDEYKNKNDNHLEYPHNISLDINKIDIATTISILKNYIENQDEYPLDKNYGEKYNLIIVNERKKYDDRI